MKFIGILGIVFLISIAVLFSKNRKQINFQTVIWGFLLQLLFAFSILGSTKVSFVAITIFVMIITSYVMNCKIWINKDRIPLLNKFDCSKNTVVALGIIIVSMAIYSGYILGAQKQQDEVIAVVAPLVKILIISMVMLWLLSKFMKNSQLKDMRIGSGLFLLAIGFSLGGCIAVAKFSHGNFGTISYNMAQLSLGISSFLTNTTKAGTEMIFGVFSEIREPWYFLFFVQVLPTIVFFSAFISVLYFLGIVQVIIEELAGFMKWTMKTSGAETLACASNIFVGQTEAPILIKPYIKEMTNSEIHAVMTGGFATIAGGVFAGFVAMGIDPSYLIGASLMSAPGALMVSKIFYPEIHKTNADGNSIISDNRNKNIIAAAAQGTSDGLQLALNVGAMLLAFIALMKGLDMALGVLHEGWTINLFFGKIFRYLAILLGVPPVDAEAVGVLFGNKIAINEFMAYSKLSKMIEAHTLSSKSQAIATYALCGFANFSSIGIQIGGISPIAPNRKEDIASLGFSAMWAGTFSSWITAAIAGIFIG